MRFVRRGTNSTEIVWRMLHLDVNMKMIIGNQLAIDKETVRCLNMYLSTTLQDYSKTSDGQSDRQASLALFVEANRIKVNGSAGCSARIRDREMTRHVYDMPTMM